MTPFELTLFGVAMTAIILIFVAEVRRGGPLSFARLPPSMLFFLRITLGIIFAILGVIGSVLPIMQGWVFFLLAFLVLFPQHRWALKALDKVEPKAPRIVAWLRRIGGTAR